MNTLEQLRDRIEFLERKLSLSTENTFKASPFEYEREAPLVTNLTNVARVAVSGSTPVALTWAVPDDIRIEAFEIWSKNLSDEAPQWVFKGAVTQPPWGDNIVSDSDKIVSFAVRTKLRNGLGTTIDNSPTVPISITAPSTSITDPAQVGPNVIGDSAFIRSGGDKIQVANADIVSLQASKITAGSISSSVAILGTVLAGQILAGTISVALSITSPNITSTSGSNVVTLSGGGLTAAGATHTTTLGTGFITIASSGRTAVIDSGAMSFTVGTNLVSLSANSPANIAVSSSGGSISLAGSTGNVNISGAYQVVGTTVISSGRNITGVDIDATGVYKVDGATVINSSGAFVGAGVDVGANGISCGNYNLNGGHIGVAGPITFTTVDGKTVTVRGGIITSIV